MRSFKEDSSSASSSSSSDASDDPHETIASVIPCTSLDRSTHSSPRPPDDHGQDNRVIIKTRDRGPTGKSQFTCWYCHKPGHTEKVCGKLRKEESSKLTCWYCGKAGHQQSECRQRRKDKAPFAITPLIPFSSNTNKKSRKGKPGHWKRSANPRKHHPLN